MKRNFRVLFLYPNMMMMHLLPSGVAVLSAALKKRGFDVEVFDTTYYRTDGASSDERKLENLQLRPFHERDAGIEYKTTDPFEDLTQFVWEYEPDLVAVSCVEDTWTQGVQLLNHIQDYLRERRVPTLVGGVFPTYAPETAIQEPAVDMVCVGEGDEAIVEVCEKLRNKDDCDRVKNLWVKVRNNGGDSHIIKNPLRDPVDMDQLPLPDYSVFERKRLLRPMAGKFYVMAPIETHRGCPYKCTFCNSPSMMKLYREGIDRYYLRLRSPEKTVQEIKELKRLWGIEYVYFNADTFLAMSDQELRRYAELYREEIGLPFWMQTRPETFNESRIALLKSMGLHRCNMGLEHGNEEFRRRVIKRNYSNEKVIEVFKLLEKSRLTVTVNNIVGYPEETRELALDTVRLNRHFNADTVNGYAFYPYHGTPLRDVCRQKGYLRENGHIKGGPTRGSVLQMPLFPKESIDGLVRVFSMYVKFEESRYPAIRSVEMNEPGSEETYQRLKVEFADRFFSGPSSD